MTDIVRQVELPPEPLGGAGELALLLKGRTEPVRWWKPSLMSAIATAPMTWIVGAFIGACMFVGWIVLLPILGVFGIVLFKFGLIGGAILVSMRSKGIRKVVAARREPFCIHCGYSLGGLEDERACPECGMPFSRSIIEDYRRDPEWFVKRFELIRRR